MACSLQTAGTGLLKLNNFSTSTAQEPTASPINSSSNQLSTLSAWQQWPFLHNRDFILSASGSSALNQHLRHSPLKVTPIFFFSSRFPSAACELSQTSLISHSTFDTPFLPILRSSATDIPSFLLSPDTHSLSQPWPRWSTATAIPPPAHCNWCFLVWGTNS